MNRKNIFNRLALAMLMPAMLLATACSSSDDDAIVNNNENTNKKGFELPVTVNVTREGDATTRATFDGSKLSFSVDDKLFVKGIDATAGQFAGTLTWNGGGTFSGTITTQNSYPGDADALFTAANSSGNVYALLLPNGYGTYGFMSIKNSGAYNAYYEYDFTKAFATSKATAVEQFSWEYANSYSSGFALTPGNAILSFAITGFAYGTEVAVSFTDDESNVISKDVTTDGEGTAKFYIGVNDNTDLKDCSLTVGGNGFTIASSSKKTVAGKIYNISRCLNAISGKFSVSSTKKVFFSKGNLQATTTNLGTTWTWAFATNQWDKIGAAAANTSITANKTVSTNGTVDLFGWSTDETYLGINKTNSNNAEFEGTFKDWGKHADVIASIGSGWRTLTGGEWYYLFITRSTTSGQNFCKAKVGDHFGVILLPDDWSSTYYALNNCNETSARNFDDTNITNKISTSDWTSMLEAHGAVFLPCTGQRNSGNVVNAPNGQVHYWSASKGDTDTGSNANANHMRANGNGVAPNTGAGRCNGFSVRLVHDVK